MIISASRRTDIPAYYSEWFFRRLREGSVCVRNPMNPRQVSRILLSPEKVDGFVFWTKNPLPMLERLDLLREYAYYFQFSLTPYGPDVESGLPDKETVLLPAFCRLSDKIGAERVIWRYDPILLNPAYPWQRHMEYFERMAKRLSGYTEECIFSFLDMYPKIRKRVQPLELTEITPEIMRTMVRGMAQIAAQYGMTLSTCAEEIDLEQWGIRHARCVDAEKLSRLSGRPLLATKDKNQRPACGCVQSVDIGTYNTCLNGCRYCYANHSETTVRVGCEQHDPASELLCGTILAQDRVSVRQEG